MALKLLYCALLVATAVGAKGAKDKSGSKERRLETKRAWEVSASPSAPAVDLSSKSRENKTRDQKSKKGKDKDHKDKSDSKKAPATERVGLWQSDEDAEDADSEYDSAGFMQDLDDSISDELQAASAAYLASHAEFASTAAESWSAGGGSSVDVDAAGGTQAVEMKDEGAPAQAQDAMRDVDDSVSGDIDDSATEYLRTHPDFASAAQAAWSEQQ